MKAHGKLWVAALAAAGLAIAAEAQADRGGHGSGGGHWSGSHGGNWSGGANAGHWRGGYWGGHGGGYRSHWYGPRVGFYFGVPVVLGWSYWGSPYYWGYPGETVVYREVIREPEAVDSMREPAGEPATSAAPAPNAGPLYMNYCESAREYYPKVTRCPEGWKFVTPTN